MDFFDLNIPYTDSDKATRIKLATKAMELGYTGIAYNRMIRGVMSERDRCSIALLSLSSLLSHAPSLSSSVRLHRDLLGVRQSSPFRQYTRLTVCVENNSQAQALNSGNHVLKTYDFVAAKPLNQNAFDHLCEKSEVDIIAIDFSEKLPFRLKFPMVKAAIERGIYFEITYSKLNTDVQSRRQMIPNAKLLVDWSRGKNLILSSAAASANELRGPYDVANLSSLLGLPMERAKISISGSCRTLLTNAIRKRKYYKETLRIELISSAERIDSKEALSDDWLNWDPISSGEGDLLFDDMAKSFSVSSKVSKSTKAIDFAEVIDNLPSNGFQVKDVISGPNVMFESPSNKIISSAFKTGEVSDLSGKSSELPDGPGHFPLVNQTSQHSISTGLQTSTFTSPPETSLKDDFREVRSVRRRTAHMREEHKNSIELGMHCTLTGDRLHIPLSQNQVCIAQPDMACAANTREEHKESNELAMHCALNEESVHVPLLQNELSIAQRNVALPDNIRDGALETCESNAKLDLTVPLRETDLLSSDANLGSQSGETDKLSHDVSLRIQHDVPSISYDKSVQEGHIRSVLRRHKEDVESLNEVPHVESHDESIVVKFDPSKQVLMENQWLEDVEFDHANAVHSLSGKCKRKLRLTCKPLLYPFKRLVNPIPFKRKAKRSRTMGRMV